MPMPRNRRYQLVGRWTCHRNYRSRNRDDATANAEVVFWAGKKLTALPIYAQVTGDVGEVKQLSLLQLPDQRHCSPTEIRASRVLFSGIVPNKPGSTNRGKLGSAGKTRVNKARSGPSK